ncbi:MAG: cobalamin B12-binding domain-containing protein [Steroidobacteraceae bacterium]|jgi:methanogenic corrinoid protein MtbC1|nr:cobalamin B12-binding domain-containing protein [Steroidobacteraceae bacterium]
MNDGRDFPDGLEDSPQGELACNFDPLMQGVRGDQPVRSGPEATLAGLARLIEAEIVPRLMLAHRTPEPRGAAIEDLSRVTPAGHDVAEFTRLLVEQDASTLSDYLDSLRARGMARETVLLQLLAPAARHLGELWEEDLTDFTQVTVGLGRLQQLLWHLAAPNEGSGAHADPRRRALLTVAPGEQHTLGLFMVRDFFRRAGWAVPGGTPHTVDEIAALVRGEWFAVVGLSLACERHIGALRDTIRAIRRASRNCEIGVLVGGPMLLARPELALEIGADGTAEDGRSAAEEAAQRFVPGQREN